MVRIWEDRAQRGTAPAPATKIRLLGVQYVPKSLYWRGVQHAVCRCGRYLCPTLTCAHSWTHWSVRDERAPFTWHRHHDSGRVHRQRSPGSWRKGARITDLRHARGRRTVAKPGHRRATRWRTATGSGGAQLGAAIGAGSRVVFFPDQFRRGSRRVGVLKIHPVASRRRESSTPG